MNLRITLVFLTLALMCPQIHAGAEIESALTDAISGQDTAESNFNVKLAEADDDYVRPKRTRRRRVEEDEEPQERERPRLKRKLQRLPADEEEAPPARVRSIRREEPIAEEEPAPPPRRLRRAPEEEPEAPRRTSRRRPLKRATAAEEVVDLSAMDTNSGGGGKESPNKSAASFHPPAGADPHFSMYFDLLLAYQPGKAGFSFLNFHPLLFLEIVPMPDLIFSFEVNPSPRYFELDYQATKNIQLRLGKIWIPFDDMNPHSFFGGLVTNSRMRLGPMAYLPDVWTDLGIGAKFTLVENSKLTVESSLYIVNGFGNRGVDPLDAKADYPSFSDISISSTDNNTDKAIGGHVQALFNRSLGLGFSFYTGRWTPDGVEAKRINMVGLNASYVVGKTQLKAGFSYMMVGLPGTSSYNRQGNYLEANHKFGAKDEWMVLGRAGYLDPDDRLTDVNDLLTIGAGIRWKPGLIQWALESYQDIKSVAAKQGSNFTFFRTIIQL